MPRGEAKGAEACRGVRVQRNETISTGAVLRRMSTPTVLAWLIPSRPKTRLYQGMPGWIFKVSPRC